MRREVVVFNFFHMFSISDPRNKWTGWEKCLYLSIDLITALSNHCIKNNINQGCLIIKHNLFFE